MDDGEDVEDVPAAPVRARQVVGVAAEDSEGGRVGEDEVALSVEFVDEVGGVVDDAAIPVLRVAEGAFHFAALRDVANDSQKPTI